MPNCQDCGCLLALCERGGICPTCKRIYSPLELAGLPGYDAVEVRDAIDLFVMLLSAGLLAQGLNRVEIGEDDMIIAQLGEGE